MDAIYKQNENQSDMNINLFTVVTVEHGQKENYPYILTHNTTH